MIQLNPIKFKDEDDFVAYLQSDGGDGLRSGGLKWLKQF